jgi:hypothetical protein
MPFVGAERNEPGNHSGNQVKVTACPAFTAIEMLSSKE